MPLRIKRATEYTRNRNLSPLNPAVEAGRTKPSRPGRPSRYPRIDVPQDRRCSTSVKTAAMLVPASIYLRKDSRARESRGSSTLDGHREAERDGRSALRSPVICSKLQVLKTSRLIRAGLPCTYGPSTHTHTGAPVWYSRSTHIPEELAYLPAPLAPHPTYLYTWLRTSFVHRRGEIHASLNNPGRTLIRIFTRRNNIRPARPPDGRAIFYVRFRKARSETLCSPPPAPSQLAPSFRH
ncbi:hypothetical protein KM043_008404 [Ampulex compressa]|nr:hypothetical protein KM043_008404 [Ampulex compressa]